MAETKQEEMKKERLLELSEKDLYIELGMELSSKLALPLDENELEERGKKWFERKSDDIRKIVCNHSFAEYILSGDDKISLITGIADLIAPLTPLKFAPFTVAAIIVKVGLTKFCEK